MSSGVTGKIRIYFRISSIGSGYADIPAKITLDDSSVDVSKLDDFYPVHTWTGMSVAVKHGRQGTKTPIVATNLKTMEVRKFASQREAGRCLKISSGNISSVLHGRRAHANGWVFNYGMIDDI